MPWEQQALREREQEEAQLREQFNAQRDKLEADARTKFEADLASSMDTARSDFESKLSEQTISSEDFEAQLTQKEADARATFEAELQAQKQRGEEKFMADLLSARQEAVTKYEAQWAEAIATGKTSFETQLRVGIGDIKREILLKGYLHPMPKALAEYSKEQRLAYAEKVQAEREVQTKQFISSLDVWQQEQLGEFKGTMVVWEAGQLSGFEKQISEWKASEQKSFEDWKTQTLASWKTEQRTEFEQQLGDWATKAREGEPSKITLGEPIMLFGVPTGREPLVEPATGEKAIEEWKTKEQANFEEQVKTWREQWRAKGLAERLMDIEIPRLDLGKLIYGKPSIGGGLIGLPSTTLLAVKPEKPQAPIAGLIAAFEAPAYSIGTLIGLKTPRVPPTFVSGVIGKGIGAVVPYPSTELERTMEYGTGYAAGTILGDIAVTLLGAKAYQKVVAPTPIGKGISKVSEYVTSPIMKRLPERIQKLYYGVPYEQYKGYKEYSKAVEALRQQFPEPKYPFELPKEYQEFWLQTQQPLIVKPEAEKWYRLTTGEPTTPMSVTLGKVTKIKPTPQVAGAALAELEPHFFEWSEQAWKLPPALVGLRITSKTLVQPSTLQYLFGAGAVLLPRAVTPTRKLEQPTLLKPIRGQIMTPLTTPIEAITPIQATTPIQALTPLATQILTPVQVATQLTTPTTPSPTPTITPTTPRPPSRGIDVGRIILGRKRKKPTRFGQYELLYPVATESQVARWIFGRKAKPHKTVKRKGSKQKR